MIKGRFVYAKTQSIVYLSFSGAPKLILAGEKIHYLQNPDDFIYSKAFSYVEFRRIHGDGFPSAINERHAALSRFDEDWNRPCSAGGAAAPTF